MRKKQNKVVKKDRRHGKNQIARLLESGVVLGGFCAIAVTAVLGGGILNLREGGRVYASDKTNEIATADGMPVGSIPAGIRGVILGVTASPAPGSRVNSFGTSAEYITVGQRVRTIGGPFSGLDLSGQALSKAAWMENEISSKALNGTMMSDSDYSTLLRIVEAEAGDDDVRGRVLVANVIMNRVAREDFPDTVTDVVFQNVNGVPQFAPTFDGSFYTVEVTDDTREAVRQALSGADYSEGALFFVMKDVLSEGVVSWFDTDLKHLFKYGVHDFYTYPEETDPLKEGKESREVRETELVKKS